MPKVFYASRTRSETPPSAYGSDESGSEASTDIEVSRRRPAHARGESIDAAQPDPKRPRMRSARDAQGRRALQKACQRNDIDRVRAALAQKADIEDRDYAGTTALHDAALNGSADIVRLLLESGAVVDVRSGLEELDTPLMDAVAAGSVAVTKLLLDAGADPRISNAVGKTAVDFLDEDDDSAKEILRLVDEATRALRSKGAPVVDSPAHANAPPNLFPPGFEARKRVASTNFIDVTRRSGRGTRAGADAVTHASQGNLAYVGLALERGWTPTPEALVKAAKFGHQEIVGLLLAFGLDADAKFEGQTALKAAVLRGHLSTAQLLLQSGASLALKDARGRTYKDLVADLPAKDPMRALIEGGKPSATSSDTTATATTSTTTATTATQAAPPRPVKDEKAVRGGKVDDKRSDESREKSQQRHAERDAAASVGRAALPSKGAGAAERAPLKGSRRESLSTPKSHGDHRADEARAATKPERTRQGKDASALEGARSAIKGPAPDRAAGPVRASSREARPGAFKLADLRAIKPKKRSKSIAEPEQQSSASGPTSTLAPPDAEAADGAPSAPPADLAPASSSPPSVFETQRTLAERSSSPAPPLPDAHALPPTGAPAPNAEAERSGLGASAPGGLSRGAAAAAPGAATTDTTAPGTVAPVARAPEPLASVSAPGAPAPGAPAIDEPAPGAATPSASGAPISQQAPAAAGVPEVSTSTAAANSDTSASSHAVTFSTGAAAGGKAASSSRTGTPAPPIVIPTAAASSSASPALSPLTEVPPEKARSSEAESPKWAERSQELAQLAKRKEKLRLAREMRMLESLAHEERRRSQEPQSPAPGSPTETPTEAVQRAPATAPSAAEVSREPTPEPPAVERAAEGAAASVRHLPYFLRQLAYTGEPQPVGPLFIHRIGAARYYLDVQVAALIGDPQLHVSHSSLPKVLVTEAHKAALWSFCRPWAVRATASGPALASEESAFTGLPLVWIPKHLVDETVFHGALPPAVDICLEQPGPRSRWATLLSESELPLRLQFRAALLQRLPEW